MANGANGDLVVRRVNSRTRDVFRAYQVWADRVQVAEVKRGGAVRVPLSPGEHRIQIKIDWCSSQELLVKIEAGAETVVSCGPNKTGTGPLRQVINDPHNYLWLREGETSAGS